MRRWHRDVVDGFKPVLRRRNSVWRCTAVHHKRNPMMGERKRRSVERLVRSSCFEPRQNPHATPACGRLFEQDSAVTNDKCVSFDKSLCARFGFLDGQRSGIFCAAEFLHRADAAFRFIRQANKRAKIDKRGIKTRRVALRDKLRGKRPEFFAADCGIDRGAHVEQSGQNTRAIRFDDWDRLIESKGCDCVRDIATNARQFANRSNIAGQGPAVPILHNAGGGTKVSRPVVIAEPLPRVKYIVLRSARN